MFERLLEKLEEQRKALGGQVFDVLGEASSRTRRCATCCIEAIRYGDQPEVRAAARSRRSTTAVGEQPRARLLAERALARDVMSTADVERIRDEMEKAEARRLQPHFIRTFFLEAFQRLGGHMVEARAGPLRDHARARRHRARPRRS